MKKIFMYNLLVLSLVLAYFAAFSQTKENFNTRSKALNIVDVKPHLQTNCWQIQDFDENGNGWTPGIEGDGALVSGPGASSTQNTGIYSPVLDVNGEITLAFSYKFNANVNARRWFKIYLTDVNNNILERLDSVEVTGNSANIVYTYDKTIWNGSGLYKIYINFQGQGGSVLFAIDNLSLSPNLKYPGGCNHAPVAVDDIIAGNPSNSASGRVTPNDYDEDNDPFIANLIQDSPDGKVTLNEDGTFTFTKRPNFNGNSTTFEYNICDLGSPRLCSPNAKVTVTFPSAASLPVTIIDLKANYDDGNKVIISWTTTFESNNDHFEIERSTDGLNFTTVGSVKAVGNSGNKNNYSFVDNINSINTSKKDIYYRVKQVDIDTKSSVTKVLIVRVYKTRAVQMISVTPNPVVNNIRVNMGLNETSMVVIKLVNNLGSEIMRKNVRAAAGNNAIELEGTSKLATGVYIMEVIVNSNERMTIKLMKN
jgi:hypothetical protein